MIHPEWRPAFHAAPAQGWLNDPNGLCFFKGSYHAFYQYTRDWPASNLRSWGHAVSEDLLAWRELPAALDPSIPEDRTGVYSGCAWISPEGRMNLYYTGNVIYEGGYDRIHEGREANGILVVSEDGLVFSEKRVLLRNADYPGTCTLHVRDPKVWEHDGSLWMVLGAREQGDRGQALVFRSDDGISWKHHRTIRSREPFGYMWECPNVGVLAGREFIALCPQGLPSEELRRHNHWHAGYVVLDGRVIDTDTLDETRFREWDFGWDFYAPQIFTDERGRTILIGWMGTFDKGRTSAPDGLPWCHCLTLARELALADDGGILQRPVCELESKRGAALALDGTRVLADHLADIELVGMDAAGALVLDGSLAISFEGDLLSVSFSHPDVGAGRVSRTVKLPAPARDARVVIDRSCVEIYLDGGETVFSTRWFPVAGELSVALSVPCTRATVWPLEA